MERGRDADSRTTAAMMAAPRANPRTAVAVLGFKNVSAQPELAWISTALAETLATELATGEHFRVIPGENVARLKTDLARADVDSYGPETLSRIRINLAADHVVPARTFHSPTVKSDSPSAYKRRRPVQR
jgi:TolB-like protein